MRKNYSVLTHCRVIQTVRFAGAAQLIYRLHLSTFFRIALCGGLVAGAIACSSDATGPKHSNLTPAQIYWSLQLNQHAVTMALTAPVNTIQLIATPLNADGNPLSGVGQVSYTSSDTVVRVDSTGLVTAQFASDNYTYVVARLTDQKQHVTFVDTCFIRVTETAPSARLASISLQDIDSVGRTKQPRGGLISIGTVATDSNGMNFTDFFSYFWSSDCCNVTLSGGNGRITHDRNLSGPSVNFVSTDTGHVTFYAQTWWYGVAAIDSLPYQITPRLSQDVEALPYIPTGSSTPILIFWPQSIVVGVGGRVRWINRSFVDTVDVVFDDPANVDSFVDFKFRGGYTTGRGNIPPWASDTLGTGSDSIANKINAWFAEDKFGFGFTACPYTFYATSCGGRSRSFPVAGVYHYHSTKQNTSGTIYVQ